MTNRVSGETLFGLPIAHEPGLCRALVEHGDGRWSICTFRPARQQASPDRPVDAECTFDLDDALETARQAFCSDPSIRDDRNAGKKLAATVLMLAKAIGLTAEDADKQAPAAEVAQAGSGRSSV